MFVDKTADTVRVDLWQNPCILHNVNFLAKFLQSLSLHLYLHNSTTFISFT